MDTGFVSAVRCLSQPDPDWGQRVSLMLVPSSKSFHEGRFRAALAQILPAYAMPKEINISDEIPVNSMGKPVDYVD